MAEKYLDKGKELPLKKLVNRSYNDKGQQKYITKYS
jgi:hypothetical protein